MMGAAWMLLRSHPLAVVGALALAGVLTMAGVFWARALEAEAATAFAQAEAAQWRAAHDTLQAATQEQAAAVRRLVADSAERSERANKAMAKAATVAESLQARVDALLGMGVPVGVDPCAAAQEAFAAELRRERM